MRLVYGLLVVLEQVSDATVGATCGANKLDVGRVAEEPVTVIRTAAPSRCDGGREGARGRAPF